MRVRLRFVELDSAGRLAEHDTAPAEESDVDIERRREWQNQHGW